jgi:crossover junction endodeoxyribonuclease RuvC
MINVDITVGIDPGFSGGIGVLMGGHGLVYDLPIETIIMKTTKRKRKRYDIVALVNILKPLTVDGVNVVFAIEDVTPMTGEGVTSSFNFGEGKGILLGVVTALTGERPNLVRPQVWKKEFPELTQSDEIVGLKSELKALKTQHKLITEKSLKKDKKKEIDALNRKVKTLAKDGARSLASSMFPDIKDSFKLKKHDGRAESLLIAKYAQQHLRGEE